jgi:hypothetical protein
LGLNGRKLGNFNFYNILKIYFSESSVLAKDFLENYDLSGKAVNIDFLSSNWENEFLNNLSNINNQEDKMQFFDYESSWESYNSKEAQEKYEFVKVIILMKIFFFLV